ncbi:MAG: metallophosphoesterase [Acetobacteraceae bacterium]|nr:metallophosphoesterase [Acetobacteraceae bacterium]
MKFETAPARIPDGRRVYAVGDIHGCTDKLDSLHAMIAADLTARPIPLPLLLHIGDYVDKGPDSAGVLERLTRGPSPIPGLACVNLMGNHERTMADALAGDRPAITDWLYTGGREALASWGADVEDPAGWSARIPARHQEFVRGLKKTHRLGGYLFVHAGIRPGVPLDQQSEDDLLRIRSDFLSSERSHGVVVVHGHTPVRHGAEIHGNRINIDTGAVFGRRLTCAVLEERRVAFLEA